MKALPLFFALLGLTPVAWASSETLDLWHLHQEAQGSDTRILRAAALQRSSSGQAREAYGRLLPQLGANGNFNRSLRDDERTRSAYDGRGLALGLSQVIYAPQVWRSYQKFTALEQQSRFDYEDARIQSDIDLAERYFTALAAEDELSLVQAELQATGRNLQRVNALFARKMAMITDVLELSARHDALQAKSLEASNQVAISREAIAELIGRPIEEPLRRLASAPNFIPPAHESQYWVDAALQNNPALRAKAASQQAAEAAVDEARAGHLPTVRLDLNAQRSDIGYEGVLTPRSDTYVASVGVQIPLYSGGSTQARVANLSGQLDASSQEYESLRRQVIRETRTAYLGTSAGVERIRASRSALQSAEKSRAAAEKAFGFGVMNAVDVLNSIEGEFRARRELLQSQYNFITSLLVLHRWSGRLNDDDILQANAWLEEAP